MQSFNTSTSFPCQQCCQVTTSWRVSNVAMFWRGPEHMRREDSRFSGSQGPPQASGCMTVLSLKHHDSKRWDKSWCSLHAVPLDSSRGRDKGVIKILQINYTKKKANYLYTKSVQGLHFAVIICTNSAGEKEISLNMWVRRLCSATTAGVPTFIIDLSVSVNVCFSNHFVHFLIS